MRNLVFICGFVLIFAGAVLLWSNTPYKYIFEGSAQIKGGKVAKAVEILKEGTKKYPDNPKINYLLANAYLLIGEIDLANKIVLEKKIINSLKNNKEILDLLVDLSKANYRVGNKELARIYAYKYLENHDENKTSHKIIEHYILLGQVLPERAVVLWEKAFNIAHALSEIELKESLKALLLPKYFEVVKELKSKKDYEAALEVLKKAELLGKSAEVNFQKALLYSEIGKPEQAYSLFEDAIQLEQENNDYKIAYADLLKDEALMTKDQIRKDECFEKIKLLLNDIHEDPRKTSLLNKIINLHAKYKVLNANLRLDMIGEYLYPTFGFRIKLVSDVKLEKYKIVFLDEKNTSLDVYESLVTDDDIDRLIEVTSKKPVENNRTINAKLFLNNDFVKEYSNK